MKAVKMPGLLMGAMLLLGGAVQNASAEQIPKGSRVYVQDMDGFGSYVIAAIHKKNVSVVIVTDREKAEYEIGGGNDSAKPGWATTIFGGHERASIQLINVKTSEVVFAYSVQKSGSKPRQSAAEACAKHIKEAIAGK